MKMSKMLMILFIFIKLYFINGMNNTTLSYDYDSFINSNNFSINEAIYNINNSDWNTNIRIFQFKRFEVSLNVEIIRDNNINSEDNYFYIKNISDNLFFFDDTNNNDFKLKTSENNNSTEKDYFLWNITYVINSENQLIYYIQNKKTLNYWEADNTPLSINLKPKMNESELTRKNEFIFNELYKKVIYKDSNLLEQEPIDVLIKYIDLSDENLNRNGISQIDKDVDNNELKYCVRSILQNIPWIRKIFILMPNEKVKFFKPIEEIKDKIVYVKDKDLLGFDSANNLPFQFNLFKMKEFGMSENFIYMDDDYFIGQPINKNEFFYEENGIIYPALTTNEYKVLYKKNVENDLSMNIRKNQIKGNNPHSAYGFFESQDKAFLLAYKIFGEDDIRYGKKLINPNFSHNAMPFKMSEINEIYNLILSKYEYGYQFLHSIERSNIDLSFQTIYNVYIKNKYDRKSSKISSEFYDLNSLRKPININKKLFVINTSVTKYSSLIYQKELEFLEKLFPNKTPYELDNYQLNIKKDWKPNGQSLQKKEVERKDLIVSNKEEFIKYFLEFKQNALKLIENEKMKSNRISEYKLYLETEIVYLTGLCKKYNFLNYILTSILVILFFLVRSNNRTIKHDKQRYRRIKYNY